MVVAWNTVLDIATTRRLTLTLNLTLTVSLTVSCHGWKWLKMADPSEWRPLEWRPLGMAGRHRNRLDLIYDDRSLIYRLGHESGPSTGRVGSVWVGWVQIFSLLSGSGRIRSICVGLCGSPWIIQNVTLSVIVKFTHYLVNC